VPAVAASNPYRYSGYIFDEETGLYYLKARYYDPETARFLSEDTYLGQAGDPLSLNLYAYVKYNPLKYYDPTGHYVSETDRANLSADQIALLEKLTKGWEAAYARGDANGMKIANDAANAVRNSANYSGGSNGDSIKVDSGKTVNVVTVSKTTTVTNNGSVVTMNIGTGVSANVTNNGKIETINNYGTTVIYNNSSIDTVNNYGTIEALSSYNGSIGTINNSATINYINTGKSTTTINNSGEIGSVIGGLNGEITVNNDGYINSIYVGRSGTLDGINNGFVGNVSGASVCTITPQWIGTSAETKLLIDNQFIVNNFLTKEEQVAKIGVSRAGGMVYKDYSDLINKPLSNTVSVAEALRAKADVALQEGGVGGIIAAGTAIAYNTYWFYNQVKPKAEWDIKLVGVWNITIGYNTYPGWGVPFCYNGMIMTPEEAGNYTYGHIGAALGLPLPELFAGSWYAAGYPISGNDWDNEYGDWNAITLGFYNYNRR